MKKICFVTTGDIRRISTAKRALGLSNPLTELGWDVSIIMEDTEENHKRCEMECTEKIHIYYFPHSDCKQEKTYKEKFIQQIDPDFVYYCAFVIRNIVGKRHRSKKLVEHCELQSKIPDIKGIKHFYTLKIEYQSILFSDGLLNASTYLQRLYQKRAKKVFKGRKPMLYYPYAYNPDVISVREPDYQNSKFSRFEGNVNFVFLGSVTRNYGVFTILEAVKELKGNNSSFNMLVLGHGRHYDEAKKYVQDQKLEDVVYMPGYVEEEEVSEYFSLASAFISPMNDTIQDWARCPSKLYLYIPFQKPVITCKIGEPYETLKDEGLYYETGNSHSLAQRMMKIINGDVKKCSLDPGKFTWEYRAKELDAWIDKVF